MEYEIQAYSNNTAGKQEEAKSLLALADDAMIGIKFERTMKTPLPNKDRSVYRLYASYRAVVAKGVVINGDTVHQVYS